MLCRPDRARLVAIGLMVVGLMVVGLTALPGSALGAKLIGGREQAAAAKAFSGLRGHTGEVVASIRASTVSPAWVVVKSVRPQRGGSGANPRLRSTYLHRAGAGFRAGRPPGSARTDLSRPFEVAIVYAGSGSETVSYKQAYRTSCTGGGGFVDQQSASVTPMSWSVRYVVDPDQLQAAVATPEGPAIVPSVFFDAAGSELTAGEKLSRTYVDNGCFDTPRNFKCASSFHLSNSGADSDLSFDPGVGTEVGLPMRSSNTGQCSPADYTIGPSLWDSGASTVLVSKLDLIGGHLPGNPYAPVRVSWPGSSALEQQNFLTSPCQGIPTSCSDSLHWHGTVRLQAVSAG
jgi:hypothetical protein